MPDLPTDVRDQLNALIPDSAARAALWKRVWKAYYEQYNAFRDANPGWQAFFSDHHGASLDAALQVFGSELIALALAEGRRQATEGWEREWSVRYNDRYVLGLKFTEGGAKRRAEDEDGKAVSRLVGPWEPTEQPEPDATPAVCDRPGCMVDHGEQPEGSDRG